MRGPKSCNVDCCCRPLPCPIHTSNPVRLGSPAFGPSGFGAFGSNRARGSYFSASPGLRSQRSPTLIVKRSVTRQSSCTKKAPYWLVVEIGARRLIFPVATAPKRKDAQPKPAVGLLCTALGPCV